MKRPSKPFLTAGQLKAASLFLGCGPGDRACTAQDSAIPVFFLFRMKASF